MSEASARLSVTSPSGSQADSAEHVLVVAGEIDAHSAPSLAEYLDPLPDSSGDIVLTMTDVSFMDSSGLRVLVDAQRRLDAGGRRLIIDRPSRQVARLVEISGLGGHFVIRE
jgi:anti-sigma B factor antagonist